MSFKSISLTIYPYLSLNSSVSISSIDYFLKNFTKNPGIIKKIVIIIIEDALSAKVNLGSALIMSLIYVAETIIVFRYVMLTDLVAPFQKNLSL